MLRNTHKVPEQGAFEQNFFVEAAVNAEMFGTNVLRESSVLPGSAVISQGFVTVQRMKRNIMCFSFTSSLGVGYLMVCTASYPNVLAFCFLDELQKEFIVTYDTKRINSAMRPYSFIEFGQSLEQFTQTDRRRLYSHDT